MFDWVFEAAIKNVISAIRILFWLIRGVVWLFSAMLNRRQNVPPPGRSDLFE